MTSPPLKPLHSKASLVPTKLSAMAKLTTDEIIASLKPGSANPLTVKADGTIMEGNHRIYVLRERSFDVDSLPRVAYKGIE